MRDFKECDYQGWSTRTPRRCNQTPTNSLATADRTPSTSGRKPASSVWLFHLLPKPLARKSSETATPLG